MTGQKSLDKEMVGGTEKNAFEEAASLGVLRGNYRHRVPPSCE